MAAGWSQESTRAHLAVWGDQNIQSQLDRGAKNKTVLRKIATSLCELSYMISSGKSAGQRYASIFFASHHKVTAICAQHLLAFWIVWVASVSEAQALNRVWQKWVESFWNSRTTNDHHTILFWQNPSTLCTWGFTTLFMELELCNNRPSQHTFWKTSIYKSCSIYTFILNTTCTFLHPKTVFS